MGLTKLTISQIQQGLKEKSFSASELIQTYFKKITEGKEEIFLSLREKLALEEANLVDQKIAQGEEIDLLSAIPCAVKDNILVEGEKCTAGSKILKDYVAPYEATVVQKIREKGSIILGKTNLDEFALGSLVNFNSSAKALVDLMALFSLTSGGLRLSASFSGLVGLKPTYGVVSRHGLISSSPSLDQIGLITRTVEDCRIVFSVIKGRDKKDSTSLEGKEVVDSLDIKKLRIGLPKEYFSKELDSEIRKVIEEAIKRYEDKGLKVEEVSLPHFEYALAAYQIIASSEMSTSLSRYDGIRYGFSQEQESLLEVYFKNRGEGFGEEVKKRILLGTYLLSADHYQDYFLKAQKVRALIKGDFDQVFKKIDFLFSPVSPSFTFKTEEEMFLAGLYTASASLAGLPALSLPIGQVGESSVGLQIIGPSFSEARILKIGELYGNIF